MKILILSTHVNTGGITSYLLTLCQGLIRQGHQIWLVSSGGDCESRFTSMGVTMIQMDIRTKSDLSPKIYAAAPRIRQLVVDNGIDILHAQTRVTQVLARLVQRSTQCVYVATCHGYFKRRLNRRIAPCWGDMTIAISTAVYEHLLDDFELVSERVCLIENGIDTEYYAPLCDERKSQQRQALGLDNRRVVGTIARLSDVKGIDILIEAMPQIMDAVPDVHCAIFGQGKEDAPLKALCRSRGLEDRITFFDTVNDTVQSMGAIDVFVMPSRQEGLGLSVMEAQSCGCPVVATNVGGLPSLVIDGQTGLLIEPESPEAVANAVIKLFKDDDLSQRLSDNGRDFIQAKFSARGMVDKTADLYARLCA